MDLRLKLDDTDFETLAESARAMIPAQAPEWTDHNIHDPGIMLIELMAWVAEAQIYSLSRTRRDERQAYARLLGIELDGPKPARGLIWPLEADEPGYVRNIVGQSIPGGTPVLADLPDLPPFRVTADQHLSPAILRRIVTHSAGGSAADNTRINRRNGATYLPFGPSPGPGDYLVLTFEGHAIAPTGSGAFGLGIETSNPNLPEITKTETAQSVDVAMRDETGERPLRVLRDSTASLTRSGVLLIDIAENEQVRGSAETPWFELILRPRRTGFLRLPRVRRIVANALEVEQQESIVEEIPEFGQGRPGQKYRLGRVGRTTEPELSVTIGTERWLPIDDLSRANPDGPRFEFDQASGELLFGNGVNGKMPPPSAPLRVAYDVCGGTLGNAPAGTRWSLRGVAGIFGSNSRPCSGGADAMQVKDLQAAARRNLATRVTYVTTDDLETAARALSGLRVARAHELALRPRDLPGTRTLLVMAASQSDLDPDALPESPLWLEAIRARLSPHLLAGERLVVVGPRYVRLGVGARLHVAASADPDKVQKTAEELLRSKFVDPETGDLIWKLGRDVTPLMVRGWLRKIEGVRTVADVTLFRDDVAQRDIVILGSFELPRLKAEDTHISVERLAPGASE